MFEVWMNSINFQHFHLSIIQKCNERVASVTLDVTTTTTKKICLASICYSFGIPKLTNKRKCVCALSISTFNQQKLLILELKKFSK